MSRIYTIIDKWYACPKCGGCTVFGKERQVGEDCCEMWLECACGHDPSPDEHVETVMGWNEDLLLWAQQIWADAVAPQPTETSND